MGAQGAGVQDNVRRKRTSIVRFIDRLRAMKVQEKETATSGLWQISVVAVPSTNYEITATHPQFPARVIQIVGDDPEALAWKLIGESIRITLLTWDRGETNVG